MEITSWESQLIHDPSIHGESVFEVFMETSKHIHTSRGWSFAGTVISVFSADVEST